MDELSQKWDNLSDIAQASITELLAGKHQGNTLSSLMTNFETARQVVETSANSAGSSMQELSKWQESLEAKLLKLKAAWQSLSQSFLKSDFLKAALDAVIGLANAVDKLISSVGTLPTLLTVFAAFRSFSGKGFFKVIEDSATASGKRIESIFGASAKAVSRQFNNLGIGNNVSFKNALDSDVRALWSYRHAIKNGVDETEALKRCFNSTNKVALDFAKNNKITTKSISEFEKQQKLANITTNAQNTSVASAKAIMMEYNSGCKNTAVSQKDFISAVSKGNPQLGKYLSGLNGAKASMGKYIVSLVGAKVATVALQIATMALNAALTMGISALISWGIKKIDELVETSKELAERIDEVTTSYEEQHSTLMKLKGDYNTSDEDSMISKYERLSKGINALGENVSLTSDEYSEYKNIVNSIADQIPSLVVGYNSQGDAILSCAGNVEQLTQAYKDLIIEQNRAVLDTGEDIVKDFQNDLSKSEYNNSRAEGYNVTDYLERFENLLEMDEDELEKVFKNSDYVGAGSHYSERMSDLLEKNGIKRDVLGSGDPGSESYLEHVVRAIKEDKNQVKEILNEASKDINSYAEELGKVTQAYFSTAFLGGDKEIGDYSHLSERMQNVITQITSEFDSSFYNKIIDSSKSDEENYKAITNYYNSMLDAFDNMDEKDAKTFEASFDLKTKFNNGEISYGEYVSSLENAGNLVNSLKLDQEVKSQIKLSLGLDEDGFVKQYNDLLARLSGKDRNGKKVDIENAIGVSTEDAKKFLDSLSAEEFSVATQLIPEIDAGSTLKEIKAAISREMAVQGLTFDLNLEVETAGIDALNTAMAESVSATGLSSDSIKALKGRYAELEAQGYDLSSMFEETSNGIHINRKALGELEQAYAKQKQTDIKEDLSALKKEYDLLTKDIDECTDASERASLYTQRDAILQQINDAATLAAQYEGLTSAYNDWQRAESAGSERDMYENIISGFETVEDEISRGWYDDGTIEFLELLTGKDLSTSGIDEVKKAWKSVGETIKGTDYSIRDFFTTNEDGESTNTGVYNFLRAVEDVTGDKDVIKRDKNDKIIGFDFQVFGGDEAIAEALGVSEELVQIMLRAADDAGFVVTLDGEWTQFADLKTHAEESAAALKKLTDEGETLEGFTDEDLNFNFAADNAESLQTELEKANNVLEKFKKNGKVDLTMEGAQEALDVAEYFTIALDKLSEPVYMQLETNQVDEDLRDPLKKMQEFEGLVKKKHLLTLSGDTEELQETEEEMNKIVEELDKLDKETKIKLGIEGLTTEEIKDKLEKGEIEIPATVDIQLEMSDDLKDMRLMMMRELGLATDEEVKLKIGYEIEDSLVDKLTDEEQQVVVKYIEENPEAWDNWSDEEKEIFIDLIASGVDLETLTNEETKKVVIDFVAKNEDEFDKLTDEEQQVVVDLITDDSALEALENHQVEIEAFARIFGVEKVDDLKKKLDSLTDEEITILTKVLGQIDVEKLKTTVAGLDDKTVQAIAEAIGKGDVEGLKTIIGGLDDKTVQAIAEAFGYSDVDELNNAIDNLDPKVVQAIAQALGITDVNSLREAINRLTGKDVDAVANVDGKNDVDNLKNSIDNLKGKTITVWADIKKKASDLWDKLTGGGGGVDGTAHVNGTAFSGGTVIKSGKAYKQGNWGAKDSGVALMGEEAPELLVRNGKWHLVGEKSAGFYGYKKGDIIFNAEQTKQIFEKGKITHGNGRGKSLATGTAFSSGSGGGTEVVVGTNRVTGETYTKSKDSNDFSETFDWIEVAVSRIERAIDRLDQKASGTWRSWSSRNKNLKKELGKIEDEIELQKQAYQEYMDAANAVDLSEGWKKKVREGKVDIETIEDEDLKEKIESYKEWYEKALDTQDGLLDLEDNLMDKHVEIFDNIIKKYEGILEKFNHSKSMLEESITQTEDSGYIVSTNYYEALINNEKKNIRSLEKERNELIKARDDFIAAGGSVDSEEYANFTSQINDITENIESSETAIIGWNNAIQDINWSVFDLLQDRISNVTKEADFLIDLMSNEKLYDDNGNLTDQGLATMGLRTQNYNTHMNQADRYGDEIDKLDKEIKKDPYNQTLIDRRNELVEAQRESILAANDEKEAIKSLVEEGINLEIEALEEKINKYEEAIDSQKDLYEYQKKVQEQTRDIGDLQKQISAYSGFTDEESLAKVQSLKLELEEAQTSLKETEWDRQIEQQKQMLDELQIEYSDILTARLDDTDQIIREVVEQVNANADTIATTLNTEATNVGTTLSTEMQSIWMQDGENVVAVYGDKFTNKMTTVNSTLKSIHTSIKNMIKELDKDADDTINPDKDKDKNPDKDPPKKEPEKDPDPPKKTIKVGGKINAGSAKIFDYKGDKSGERQYYRKDPIYKVLKADGNWLQVRWHKLKSGITGWFKKGDVKAYATGKKNILEEQLAWTQEKGREMIVRPSDGAILTPIAKKDSVLNARASSNIWDMANNPENFIRESLGFGMSNAPINSNVNNNYTQHIGKVVFNMDNVKNYDEMLYAMQKDKNFQRLICAMTIDQIAGKSKLAKNKSIR